VIDIVGVILLFGCASPAVCDVAMRCRIQASSDDGDASSLLAPSVNTAETSPTLVRCDSLRHRDTRPVGRVRVTPVETLNLAVPSAGDALTRGKWAAARTLSDVPHQKAVCTA
jgi:hypothetical protein